MELFLLASQRFSELDFSDFIPKNWRLLVKKKRSPKNFDIRETRPLIFSNESMMTPCPRSFDKKRRDSQNFRDGQGSPKTSEQISNF